jgi:hypothetical protein
MLLAPSTDSFNSIRRVLDEAVSPASIISLILDLGNFLTSSGVKLEWFGSILLLVPFLLISAAAVREYGLGQQSNL